MFWTNHFTCILLLLCNTASGIDKHSKLLNNISVLIGKVKDPDEDIEQENCEDKVILGSCRMHMPMFIFNSSTKACDTFISGGCDKGPLFLKKSNCKATCINGAKDSSLGANKKSFEIKNSGSGGTKKFQNKSKGNSGFGRITQTSRNRRQKNYSQMNYHERLQHHIGKEIRRRRRRKHRKFRGQLVDEEYIENVEKLEEEYKVPMEDVGEENYVYKDAYNEESTYEGSNAEASTDNDAYEEVSYDELSTINDSYHLNNRTTLVPSEAET